VNACDLIIEILAINQNKVDALLASENATLNSIALNLEKFQ
jgi:hypothetical protein